MRFFDMGGFNHLVSPTDQVTLINQFKDGFTKNYIFYPPILHIKLNKIAYLFIVQDKLKKECTYTRYDLGCSALSFLLYKGLKCYYMKMKGAFFYIVKYSITVNLI